MTILDELKGKRLDFLPSHEVEKTIRAVERAMKGERVRLQSQRLTKSKQLLDVHISSAPYTDPEGNIAGLIVITKDFSELKRAERELAKHRDQLEHLVLERTDALKASEEKYRRVVENANESIVVVQEGRLRFVNPATIAITGYSREEALSRPFVEFIHPEDRNIVMDRYRRRQQGEQIPDTYSLRIIHKTGAPRWIEVHAEVIEWEGKAETR